MLDHFGPLEDPRIDRNKRHALLDILVLVISAVCSTAKGWEAIEDFGHAKLDWLRQFVPLENGVPSHDCIEYVMVRLSPVKFRECFMNWTQAVRQGIDEVIAVDGKTARGSRGRATQGKPLHMVTAWACKNRLVLAQEATDEKSNEITAIPKLLELLELKGCIVTLDAMGCRSQSSLAWPKSSIASQPLAVLQTALITNTKMSSRAWRLLRSIRGSSNGPKWSSKLAPVVFLSR